MSDSRMGIISASLRTQEEYRYMNFRFVKVEFKDPSRGFHQMTLYSSNSIPLEHAVAVVHVPRLPTAKQV